MEEAISSENFSRMSVASLFVIITAKQLTYVIKGCQNHNERGAKYPYYEHPFQYANDKDYHGKTRTIWIYQVHHRVRKEFIKVP